MYVCRYIHTYKKCIYIYIYIYMYVDIYIRIRNVYIYLYIYIYINHENNALRVINTMTCGNSGT